MYRCINCNAQGVERTGDEFQCPKCKYVWDVAHEQANVAYLASQGRKPAELVGDVATAETPEDGLMKELGLTPTEGEPAQPEKPGDELVVNKVTEPAPAPDLPEKPAAGEQGDSEGYQINLRIEGDLDGETELVVDPDAVLIKLNATTVPLLKAMAEEHVVDLTDASKKADIIERLLASGKLTAVYAPDGAFLDVE